MIGHANGTVTVSGPVTMDTVPELLGAGLPAGTARADLAGVTEVDSAVIALLLEWARAAGKPLAVSGAPANVRNLARLYGVEGVLLTNS